MLSNTNFEGWAPYPCLWDAMQHVQHHLVAEAGIMLLLQHWFLMASARWPPHAKGRRQFLVKE